MQSWYIDDIMLMVPLNFDATISSITVPGTITSPQEVGGVFQNLGNTVVTDFNVGFQAYNGIVYDTNYTGIDLELFESLEFTFDQMWVQPFGTEVISMWINSVNGIKDDYPGNDTSFQKHNLYREYIAAEGNIRGIYQFHLRPLRFV